MTPQELKNSILQRAIQGKLVEQRPEEGTAEELYQQIQAEKQALIKAGKIKKDKPLPEIAEDEKPFDIPESWKWVRVGAVFNVGTGTTPSKTENRYYSNGTIPWVNSSLTSMRYINEVETYVTQYAIEKTSLSIYPAHTLIIAMYGQGKTRGQISELFIPATINQACAALVNIFQTQILTNYIYYFFLFNYEIMRKKAEGTSQPNLNVQKIKETIVPLPPLAEQKRIVAKIEELLPLIDRYDAAWSRLEAFNKRFPGDMQKSLLQMAIQGKLVEQRSEEGTGEELYMQIQAEKQALIKAGKIKKDKPLPEIAEDEKPFDIPESWKWVRIQEIFRTSSGTTPSKANPDYYSSKDFNWVRTTDLNNGVLTKCEIQVSKKAYAECRLEIIPRGSVCLAMYGGSGTIGKNALINFDTTINQSVCAIHPNIFCDMSYVQAYMKYYRPYWMEHAAGSRKDPNINQVIIKETAIPLPPLAEQKRIVAKLEALLPLCERLK